MVVASRAADEIDRVVAHVGVLESLWSRFIAASDISRINDAQGEVVDVAQPTLTLLTAMKAAWVDTCGWFDPCVLPQVVNAGFIPKQGGEAQSHLNLEGVSGELGGVRSLVVDAEHHTAQLEAGYVLDPGGIGKGLAVDLAVEASLQRGSEAILVNLGGDLRVSGDPQVLGTEFWGIDVEAAGDRDRSVLTLSLDQGAVATSSVTENRWVAGGVERHHLIDPSTRCPASSDVASATVIGSLAWKCEVFAKAALLMGSREGKAFVEARGFDVLIQRRDGTLSMSDSLRVACQEAW